ncbi:MAG: flagellar protein FliS [Sphingopyxis sp.]
MVSEFAANHPAIATYENMQFSARVNGATAGGLVSILYEELEKSLIAIEYALKNNLTGQLRLSQVRFLSIIMGLEGGLNYEQGGAVAKALGSTYHYIRLRTLRAIAQHDASQIASALRDVSGLADAWAHIQRRNPVPA